MTELTLICKGASARAKADGVITQGMAGIPVRLECDEAWQGLRRLLKARCADVVRTVEVLEDTVVLPYECLLAGQRLDIGLDGWDDTGELRIPSGWACCGLVQPSVAECDGEPGGVPVPPEDTVNAIYERMEATERAVEELSQRVEELPVSDVTEQTVSGWGFTKNTGTYVKPASGIPETDLAAAVQEKLNNAPSLEDVPGNLVLFEETEESEDEQTIEALMLDKLTLEADGTYVYLKFGDTVLGMVEAGSGGGAETIYCTDIVIDQEALTIPVSSAGDQILTATVSPSDCTQLVRWSSSKTSVVTVSSDGALTAVGAGTATITARCGSKTASITVTVVDYSMQVYLGYYSSWSYNTPSTPLLAARSGRGYSSCLPTDNLHKHNGEEYDTEHARAIRIEPGCSYVLRYSGTDTNWYCGWCILSDTEKLNDYGWQNIGTLKEVTINNTYDTGIYLYFNLKYGSAGTSDVTSALLSEFISNFSMERVV